MILNQVDEAKLTRAEADMKTILSTAHELEMIRSNAGLCRALQFYVQARHF